VFLRESEEERVLVVFNNSSKAREFPLAVGDLPAQGSPGMKLLFGDGVAEIAVKGIRIRAPGKSISIFELN
jgi:hypothetical protein